jgi:hypothetical protein
MIVKKLTVIGIFIMFLSTTIIVTNASTISSINTKYYDIKNNNRQVYLGYANIKGYGDSSILEAVAENDLAIGINSHTSYVDFYIDYNINCSGLTDEGVITLTVSINGKNITPTFVQTPTIKSGMLKIENVEVNRQDVLFFIINIAYGSIIPFYTNSTSASGAGIFNKNIRVILDPISALIQYIKNNLNIYSLFNKGLK